MGKTMRTTQNMLSILLWGSVAWLAHAEGIAVIGHATLPKLDAITIQKLYTGKIVEVNGITTTVINTAEGNPLRDRFLASIVNMDAEKYTAYWTVRKYIGKGTPPKELPSDVDVMRFVRSHPGAIAYVDMAQITNGVGVNVLYKINALEESTSCKRWCDSK